MPPVTVPDGKLQPTKRVAGLTRLQTHCLRWHFLSFSSLPLWMWRWAPSVGLGWGATTAMQWRGKGRGPGMRPFLNDSVYQRTGLVFVRDAVWFSESSPGKPYLHSHWDCSQRALGGQQEHAHTLAKHIQNQKGWRKRSWSDCPCTP